MQACVSLMQTGVSWSIYRKTYRWNGCPLLTYVGLQDWRWMFRWNQPTTIQKSIDKAISLTPCSVNADEGARLSTLFYILLADSSAVLLTLAESATCLTYRGLHITSSSCRFFSSTYMENDTGRVITAYTMYRRMYTVHRAHEDEYH